MSDYKPPTDRPKLSPGTIDQIIPLLTRQQKAELIVGAPLDDRTCVGATVGLPDYGIPPTNLADGPAGVNFWKYVSGHKMHSTFFPDPLLMATTWDTPLVEELGRTMAEEAKRFGMDVLLSPGVNILRNPLNGRTFEYFSEDPLIAGEMGGANIRGIQSQGIGSSLKHLIMNNQETYRVRNSVVATARTIREIYLKPFEIAIKNDPWIVMSSYNQLFGVQTCESPELITRLLREEWDWKGLVTTDWGAGQSAPKILAAGNEMIQDYQPWYIDALVKNSPDADLDRSVHRILEFVLRTPAYHHYTPTMDPDLEAHAKFVRAIAPEGMTLLKNDRNTLPLPEQIPVALFGRTSYETMAGGTGCAIAPAKKVVSIRDGFEGQGYVCDAELCGMYDEYIKKYNAEHPPAWDYAIHYMMPELELTKEIVHRAAEKNGAALYTVGKVSGEAYDRDIETGYCLMPSERAVLDVVCEEFHSQNKPVIVVLNIPGPVEMASWKDQVDAVLLAWYPGQEAGHSIVDVLSGKANPNGKLTMTWTVKYEDNPSAKNFPDVQRIHKNPRSVKETRYEEGIYVGYRHFVTHHLPVLYPFGYGLSYTTYEYSSPSLTQDPGKSITVSIDVTNTGKVPGREIVQIYVSAPGKDMDKPERELKGWAKTGVLQPGEKARVEIAIPEDRLTSFNEHTDEWVLEGGEYTVHICTCCTDTKFSVPFHIEGRVVLKCLPLFHQATPLPPDPHPLEPSFDTPQ